MEEIELIDLKIDRTTLPKDGEQICWQTQEDFDNGKWNFGTFSEGDDLFVVGFENTSKDWALSWKVLHWKALNIEWDFVMWSEKCHNEAQLKGIDDLGFEYFGTANWVDGEALYGVKDIEKIE